MEFNSNIISKAVEELSKFPGIGKKTALRMALSLIKRDQSNVEELAEAIIHLKTKLNFCDTCGNVSESQKCSICSSHNRDGQLICVVRDFQDIIAIEETGQYNGKYHVLGGLISPLEGIGPKELNLKNLFERVKEEQVKELILGLSATMEGDTTCFYISRKVAESNIKITLMSRGISVGGELEYADSITLARSIKNRVPFSEGST